ncbi:MAG: hypothetical protein M4579_007216 [Chaenotheca gracillima]|nr:MAG: hypothetical protein M4579_007216 [Chaenotheca gracillima]
MSDSTSGYEFIIVGGGAMGVSTAFHLSHHSKSILVLDHQFLGAASRDVNKIVRFDYTDSFYMNLAREARSVWTSSQLFKDHFHPTGRVVAYDDESHLSSIKANHKLNGLSVLEDLSPADAAQKLGGLINCPNRPGQNATFNPFDAWVNFPECVAAMQDESTSRGVQFKNDLVEKLSLDIHGSCTGVVTTDGVIPCSRKVIVAAGAWTEKLLATNRSLQSRSDTGTKRLLERRRSWLPNISVLSRFASQTLGRRDAANARLRRYPVATGVCVVHFALHGEELEWFNRNPIFSYLGHGEILPPTDKGILKMTVVKSFTNMNPDLQMSVPLEACGKEVPKALHEEVQNFVDMVCPTLSNRERVIRLYWDGITATQDPIIDTLPNDVVLATGGSYHMAKFLPIIGKFVVAEINGLLADPQKSRWTISNARSAELGNQPYLMPDRDLHDLSF